MTTLNAKYTYKNLEDVIYITYMDIRAVSDLLKIDAISALRIAAKLGYTCVFDEAVPNDVAYFLSKNARYMLDNATETVIDHVADNAHFDDNYMKKACKQGNLYVVKKMIAKNGLDYYLSPYNGCADLVCANLHKHVYDYMVEIGMIKDDHKHALFNRAFQRIEGKSVDHIKQFCGMFDYAPDIESFSRLCSKMYNECAKWVFTNNNLDLSEAFRRSTLYNNAHMMRWLNDNNTLHMTPELCRKFFRSDNVSNNFADYTFDNAMIYRMPTENTYAVISKDSFASIPTMYVYDDYNIYYQYRGLDQKAINEGIVHFIDTKMGMPETRKQAFLVKSINDITAILQKMSDII